MGVFLFIFLLLLLLLIFIIIGSVQDFTLWCTTKQKHETIFMLIPALLSFILFVIITIITYFTLRLFDIDTLNILYSVLMKFEYSLNDYIFMIISYILAILLFVFLQAFCIKLSNIDYSKMYNCIKNKIKKYIVKNKESTKELNSNENVTNLPANTNVKESISFFYAFSASLFAFAICFFSALLLFYIGTLIGQNYIIY